MKNTIKMKTMTPLKINFAHPLSTFKLNLVRPTSGSACGVRSLLSYCCFTKSLSLNGDPGFGGDDGEPELQKDAFAFGWARDRYRMRIGVAKKFMLTDEYTRTDFQAGSDFFKKKLRKQ